MAGEERRVRVEVEVLGGSGSSIDRLLTGLSRAVGPLFTSDLLPETSVTRDPLSFELESPRAVYALHLTRAGSWRSGHRLTRSRKRTIGLLVVDDGVGITAEAYDDVLVARHAGVEFMIAVVLRPRYEELPNQPFQAEIQHYLLSAGFPADSVRTLRADPNQRESMLALVDALDVTSTRMSEGAASGSFFVVQSVDMLASPPTIYATASGADAMERRLEAFSAGERYELLVEAVPWVGGESDAPKLIAFRTTDSRARNLAEGDVLATPGLMTYVQSFSASIYVPEALGSRALDGLAWASATQLEFNGRRVHAAVNAEADQAYTGDLFTVTVSLSEATPLAPDASFAVFVDGREAALGIVTAELSGIDDQPKEVTVWFGTNRALATAGSAGVGFLNGRDDAQVHYGSCRVTIPRSHRFGRLKESWWKAGWRYRWPGAVIQLGGVRCSGSVVDFGAEIRAALDEDDEENRALVYLHGYNMNFEQGAIRAAQLDADLNLPGITAFYSWPSHAALPGYFADRDLAEASTPHFIEFLRTLVVHAQIERIDLVVHSMGNQLFTNAFDHMVKAAAAAQIPLGVVILAAPDVAVPLFQQKANALGRFTQNSTMYVSKNDLALWVASKFQGGPRAGHSSPVTVVPGIDTVDASAVNLSMLGHGYYGEAHAVLYDIRDIMGGNHSPSTRVRLHASATPTGGRYWRLI